MGQTKHKPLRMRYFLRFSGKNCGLNLKHNFLFKVITRNRTSNIQILKFLKVIKKMEIVSKNLFRLLGCLKNEVLKKEDVKCF